VNGVKEELLLKQQKENKMNTNFIIHEHADMYHKQSRNGKYLSSHLLADFRESPVLYRMKINKEIEETESPAFTLGRAAHSLILEGRNAFDKEYVISDGPINPKTGESYGKNTKAYAEWKSTQDKEIISGKDFGFLVKLQTSVWLHHAANKLLCNGIAEGVVRTEYCGIPCQIRMDWFNPEHGLVDLKTCESLKWFESDCHRYGYIMQLAFYRAIIRQVTRETVAVHIIAVEKTEPHSTGVWKISQEALDAAEKINEAAIKRLRECYKTNEWPTGYEDIRIINNL
jgi:hypothetical protein